MGRLPILRRMKPRQMIPLARLKRFTAAEYDQLTGAGVLKPEDRMELLEGFLVNKMAHYPPHATALGLLEDILIALLIAPWIFRTQRPISLTGDNIPEPDLVVVKGPRRRYAKRCIRTPQRPSAWLSRCPIRPWIKIGVSRR